MERRSHARKNESQSVQLFWYEGAARLGQPGTVVNSSPGGLGVEVKLAIPVGSIVSISVGKRSVKGIIEHRSASARGYIVGIDIDSCALPLIPKSVSHPIRLLAR